MSSLSSSRKIAANRQNSSVSTGPRTQGSKFRSRLNARRHGLASQFGEDQRREFDRLMTVLATDSSDPLPKSQARIFAECHVDLQRIRAAREEVFQKITGNESEIDLEIAASAIKRINRYERRALSRRKLGLKKILSP